MPTVDGVSSEKEKEGEQIFHKFGRSLSDPVENCVKNPYERGARNFQGYAKA